MGCLLGCTVKRGQIQVEKDVKTFFTNFLHTVCIPSCCIFSPDQGRGYCYHQFKVRMYGTELPSPMHSFTHASMLPLPAPRLGNIQDAWPTLGRPAGILGHSFHCKAFNVCDDMQLCCLVTPVPSKARPQSRCASTASTAVAITRSHASRENNAFSSFALCLRPAPPDLTA